MRTMSGRLSLLRSVTRMWNGLSIRLREVLAIRIGAWSVPFPFPLHQKRLLPSTRRHEIHVPVAVDVGRRGGLSNEVRSGNVAGDRSPERTSVGVSLR